MVVQIRGLLTALSGFVYASALFVWMSADGGVPSPPSLDDVVSLYRRETHFDFCGNGCGCAMRQEHTGRMVDGIEVVFGLRYGDVQYDDYFFRIDVQNELERLETACRRGDGSSNTLVQFSRRLLALKHGASTNACDKTRLLMCVERVEYLLARVVESGDGGAIGTAGILALLPDELFLSGRQGDRETFFKFKMFRNFLVIGERIFEFKWRHGRLPTSLAELSGVAELLRVGNGMRVRYEVQADVWQLMCGGERSIDGKLVFNAYVPLLRGRPECRWPLGRCIWLSSDFSEKRRQLYHQGELNQGTPWACRMVEGRVVKPEEFRIDTLGK